MLRKYSAWSLEPNALAKSSPPPWRTTLLVSTGSMQLDGMP